MRFESATTCSNGWELRQPRRLPAKGGDDGAASNKSQPSDGGTERRSRVAVRSRTQRIRLEAIFAIQSGVAAGLAWFLALPRCAGRHEPPWLDTPTRPSTLTAQRAESEWRLSTLLHDGERAPTDLGVSLGVLADGVRSLRKELDDGRDPIEARTLTLEAVRVAAAAYTSGVGLSGSAVVAQLDSTATELLRAGGLEHRDASSLVRQASTVR